MKLEDIGFYSLEDKRAKKVSSASPMWRCELILTDACNFKCPYCRGIDRQYKKTLSFSEAENVVNMWADEGLKNIRFSGGEPTIWPHLRDLVIHTKNRGVERIAVSTNGFNSLEYYKDLIKCGVNDYSISFDACCASTAKSMSGGIDCFDKIVNNIRELSKLTYVTIGVVLDPNNFDETEKTIRLAYDLGVSDIRIISSAQWNDKEKFQKLNIPNYILNQYPILKYRVGHYNKGINVRGLSNTDSKKCSLMIDDSIVIGNYHYPCIIHARESRGKNYIGKVNQHMRSDRIKFYKKFDTHKDKICRENCLDVCRDYNNKVEFYANRT